MAISSQQPWAAFVQQVIIQVWISTHFGVLSEQLPVPDENILFIRGIFTRSRVWVKGNRAFFGLLQGCIKLGLANATKVPDQDWLVALPVALVVVLVLVLDFPALSFEDDGEDEDD